MLHFFSATCCKKSWGFNDYLPPSSVTHIQTSLMISSRLKVAPWCQPMIPGGFLSLKWEGQGFGIAIPGMREIQSDQLKIQVSSTTRFGWRANFRHWLNHPLFKNIIPFTLTFSRSLSGTGQRTPKVLERHLQGPAVFIKRMWRYFQGQQDINNIQQVITKTKIWNLLISLTVISPNSACVRTWPSRRPLSKLPPHHRTEEFLGRLTCPGWVRIFWSCVSELWKLF